MVNIEVISRAGAKVVLQTKGTEVSLPGTENVLVKLGIGANTVVEMKQEGDHLIVVLSNGEVITIDNYFAQVCEADKPAEADTVSAHAAADTGNQLVLENDTGNLIWARTTVEDNCLNSVEYFSIDNITPLLTEGSIDVDHAVAWWGWKPILGYGAVITAAIIGLSQWDD
uniref:BapA/Bap/LapF family prefix-like domain-containing protein n=2 Tax=Stenoxybacter acetivorans TaxID=422441 RepID=UPI00056447C8